MEDINQQFDQAIRRARTQRERANQLVVASNPAPISTTELSQQLSERTTHG